MRIEWIDKQVLLSKAQEAFSETMAIMGTEFTKAITTPMWPWPDGAERDIVDTGRLRDSYQLSMISAYEAEHTWNTEYAAAIHEGAVLRNGGFITARPWTREVLKNTNFGSVFSTLLMSKYQT